MPSTGRFAAVCAVALALVLSGCSKTDDLPPDRRLFGEPPVIEVAELERAGPRTFTCDFGQVLENIFCPQGGPSDFEYISDGAGAPGVFVGGTYTEVLFNVRVTDGEDTFNTDGTVNTSDILLVGASYHIPPSDSESTLVILDDGGSLKFERRQTESNPEHCDYDEFGACTCRQINYELTSNDVTKGDRNFTRGIALVTSNVNNLFYDCLIQNTKQAPIPVSAGVTFSFRVDAVDKKGNLDTWHEDLPITPETSQITCEGDPCGCCIYKFWGNGEWVSECSDRPGMFSPSAFPNGFCVDAL